MPKTRDEALRENKIYIGAILLLLLSLGVAMGFIWGRNYVEGSSEFCFPKEEIKERCVLACNELDAIYMRFNQTVNLCECIEIHNKMMGKEIIRTGVLK